MTENQKSIALEYLERVDAELLALDATLEVTAMGTASMVNGEYLENILNCIRHSLQSMRAEIDEATGTVMIAKVVSC